MKKIVLILSVVGVALNGCADYTNAKPTIGYGFGVAGVASSNSGAVGTEVKVDESGEIGGAVIIDSGFRKL